MTDQSVPMCRLTDRMVRSMLVTAWRLATSPTSTSPFLAKATTEGVVRAPSAFAMTVGSPPSRTATTLLVVPRSMPTARAKRRTLRGMVAMDRVGVGDVVPVGSADEPDALSDELRSAARRAGVPTLVDTDQKSSDHWSFVREGMPGARLGSTSYAGYHSPADVPSVVDPAQLERVAHVVVQWLR